MMLRWSRRIKFQLWLQKSGQSPFSNLRSLCFELKEPGKIVCVMERQSHHVVRAALLHERRQRKGGRGASLTWPLVGDCVPSVLFDTLLGLRPGRPRVWGGAFDLETRSNEMEQQAGGTATARCRRPCTQGIFSDHKYKDMRSEATPPVCQPSISVECAVSWAHPSCPHALRAFACSSAERDSALLLCEGTSQNSHLQAETPNRRALSSRTATPLAPLRSRCKRTGRSPMYSDGRAEGPRGPADSNTCVWIGLGVVRRRWAWAVRDRAPRLSCKQGLVANKTTPKLVSPSSSSASPSSVQGHCRQTGRFTGPGFILQQTAAGVSKPSRSSIKRAIRAAEGRWTRVA